ncbi:MAG: guanylate kinase [Alphaproteobacteria bacterium]|jgi:guanylate kinase|nr:MAG: guanylate kinase [Alphaproteobacteria bacterium]|tara:strand:+ start:1922 stop:2569 length:648 start_codon:yes stop_codon:yes gene_type:complete
MGVSKKGILVILSSPSGAGKTSIARALVKGNENFLFSVSATTRKSRPGEVNGREYDFLTVDQFRQKIKEGQFLEHAKVFGNLYGTPLQAVRDSISQGKSVVFDVDWQGGKQIRSSSLSKFVISIFILPPSIKELHDRLMNRAQDSSETVKDRMKKSIDEIMHWKEYDYVIVNRDFDKTLREVESIITSEKLRRVRNNELEQFVTTLTNEFKDLNS